MFQMAEHLSPQIAGLYHGTADTGSFKQGFLQAASLVCAGTAHKVKRAAYTRCKHHAGNAFFADGP
jgi:hypothetical protein